MHRLVWVWLFIGVLALGGFALAANMLGEAAAEDEQLTIIAQAEEEADFSLDVPVDDAALVELPPEKSKWLTVGGPILLGLFLVVLLWLNKLTVPFTVSKVGLNLHQYPTGVKRGLALAVISFGIAYCLGASEIIYQLHMNGSAEAYFHNMSLGKLIAFSHAHLFGFVTSFLIVGVPFSMQFNHLQAYQWFLPVGISASMTDVISWWGIKYISVNFEYISMVCGILFAFSYLYMLIGLLRVLLFPHVIWFSDRDAAERRNQLEQSKLRRAFDRLM
ncbi:MAG: hypothetical protein ACREB3_08550, partial [Burkholderiales bacterium]